MRARRWLQALLLACVLIWSVGAHAEELQVWMPDVNWANPDVIQGYLQEFSEQTGIAVKGYPTAWSDLHQKLQIAVAGGAGPDVAIVNRQEVLSWAVLDRFLQPLDELLGPTFKRSDYFEPTMQEVLFQGRMYAVPFDFQLRGLYWNTRLFDEAGLPADRPPESIDDLVPYDQKLTRTRADGTIDQLGFYPHGDNWYAQGWIWTFGGGLFDWETGAVTIDQPKNLKAYEWFQEWANRRPLADVQAFYQAVGGKANAGLGAFEQDKVGLLMHAATYITNIRKDYPDLRFHTGRVPMPPGGANGIWAGGLSVIIPQGSRDPVAAAKLVRFLTSKEIQTRWFETTERFPAHKEALTSVPIEDPDMRAIAAQSSEQHPKPPLFGTFSAPINSAKMAVLRLEKTPSEALADAQQEVQSRLDEVHFREMWQK